MFASYALTAILASVIILPTLADVVPNGPGPGDSFNTGQPCNISWAGDASSTTAWSNMTITLKTGQNLNMIYLDSMSPPYSRGEHWLNVSTAVAVTQDGTKDGTFSWPCPAVSRPCLLLYLVFDRISFPGHTELGYLLLRVHQARRQRYAVDNAFHDCIRNWPEHAAHRNRRQWY